MARTFEKRKREQAAEKEIDIPGFDEQEWFTETGVRLDGETLLERFSDIVDILRAAPGELAIPADERENIVNNLRDVNIEGLDNTQLLQLIAQTLIEQLAVLIDIAQATEPALTVTVSGTEAIDEADEAQLVVPQSDAGNIPTRALFIRNNPSNADVIWFGDNGVTPQDGFPLVVGEYIIFPIDLRSDQIYMASETVDQVVDILGVF